MLKVAAYLLVGLGVGFAVAVWTRPDAADNAGLPAGSANSIPLERRISELERQLVREQRARESLAADLAELRGALVDPAAADGSRVARGDDGPAPNDAGAGAEQAGAAQPPVLRARLGRGVRGLDDQALAERFVAEGIAPDRAQWIVQRSSELRMEALQARYDAARDGSPLGPGNLPNVSETLRAELGEGDYERYRDALGLPTAVGIGSVLASSPAERAGLEPGDEIVAYGGKRVFDMNELNDLTIEGQPGESVAVDVLRDGQPIQLYLPRGPIGITGGGRFRGRP